MRKVENESAEEDRADVGDVEEGDDEGEDEGSSSSSFFFLRSSSFISSPPEGNSIDAALQRSLDNFNSRMHRVARFDCMSPALSLLLIFTFVSGKMS